MPRSTRAPRCRFAGAAAISALLPLALAAPATQAATSVDTPIDGTPLTSTTTAPTTFAASGSATTESQVSLMCARKLSDGWHYTALSGGSGLPVSGGQWAAAAVEVPYNINPCRLLALPTGGSAPGPTIDPQPAYQGPRLRYGTVFPLKLTSGTNAGGIRDFSWDAAGLEASAQIGSIAGSGIAATQLIGPEPSKGAGVFRVANAVARFAPGSPTAGTGNGRVLGLQVDGVNTWLAASWVDAGGDATPFGSYGNVPLVGAAPSVAATGALTLAEHDALRRCTGTDPSQYPLGGLTCQDSLVDPGVKLDVTTTVPPAGDVLRRDWSFVSTDGKPHDVDLVLSDFVSSSSGAVARAFRIGAGAYAEHAEGDVVTDQLPVAGPFSIAVGRAGGPAVDPVEGFGAITASDVPTALRFTGPRQLTASYHLSVPASGSGKALTFFYATEDHQAAVDADILAAESALRATPLGGTTTPDGGSPTPPNETGGAGGGGGTPVPGANAIPGVTPGAGDRPAMPTLTRSGKARLRGKRLTLGYAVACPGTGPACRADVSLAPPRKKSRKAPRPLGKAILTIPAGRTLTLLLTVKAKKAAIRRAKPTLTVKLSRGSDTATPVTTRWRF